MKKILTILTIAIFAVAISCQKDPIGKTETTALAGQWYVIYNCVDANGDIIPGFEDFNEGYSLALTFSVASNTVDSLWVSDTEKSNLLGYQVKVPCNLNDLTFGSSTEEPNRHPDSAGIGAGYMTDKAVVSNGKIFPGAATTPSGMPADSIYFEVKLSDDVLAATFGYDHYQVVGYRYTGFAGDE